jgi:hypothetical protein
MSCLDAAFNGDLNQLKSVDSLQGSDLFLRNALFYASAGGHAETVERLLFLYNFFFLFFLKKKNKQTNKGFCFA